MTLHCLTAVATTATDVSQSDAQTQVHDLLVSYDPALRTEEIEIQQRGDTVLNGQDIPEHLYGRYRFADASTDKATVMHDLTTGLQEHADVDTFEIAYHECDHAQPPQERTDCTPHTEAVTDPAPPDAIRL
jgi:hypothetical protein